MFGSGKMFDMYKLLKKPFFGRFMVKWQSPLSGTEKSEWMPLSQKSKSGGELKGLFAKSRTEETKATIVLGHPMGKEAKGYFIKNKYTDFLRNAGFNTLIFDINGFGESTHGNFSFFEDIIAISKMASELSPNLPIGYHGISLGGQFATIAFADENHRYDFAIIESAATSLPEFWKQFPLASVFLKIFYLFMPQYGREINMIERIKEAKNIKSLLLVYSESDKWVTVDMGKRFKNNSPVPTELWIVKNSAHAQMMKSEHKEEYQNKILRFFNDSVNMVKR
jgi:alpha-beta hydrolase superfamily lysophospholipase